MELTLQKTDTIRGQREFIQTIEQRLQKIEALERALKQEMDLLRSSVRFFLAADKKDDSEEEGE
jgi:hypothetical protein